MTEEEQLALLAEMDKELQLIATFDMDAQVAKEEAEIEAETAKFSNELFTEQEQIEKEAEALEKANIELDLAIEEEIEKQEKEDKEREKKEKEEAESIKEDKPTDEEIKLQKLGRIYPNKSAIKKLNEKDAITLGESLDLPVSIDLKASENDDIIIKYFQENIWK